MVKPPIECGNPTKPAGQKAGGGLSALGLGNVSDPTAVQMALEPGRAETCTFARIIAADTDFDALASAEPGQCSSTAWWLCDNRAAAAMLAVAPTHVLGTLTQDDLDGLDVLYPSSECKAARLSGPLHVPTASWYAGWTLVASCAVPLAVLAFVLPPCAALARCMHVGFSPVDEELVSAGRTDVNPSPEPEKLSGREYRM